MNETLIGLSLAYVFITALLLLALVYSRVHPVIKAILVIIALGFYWLSYQGWKNSQGWPSHAELPAHFLLHYGIIEEPDPEAHTSGAIYLWVTDLAGHQLDDQPRAYRLEYDRDNHGPIEDALRKTRNGKLQLGKNLSKPDPTLPKEINDGLGDTQMQLQFDELPDPALPEK